MSGNGSKWLADKALAQLRNMPRLDLVNIQTVGRNPVRKIFFSIVDFLVDFIAQSFL